MPLRTLLVIAALNFVLGFVAVADDFGNSPLAAAPMSSTGELVQGCIETAGDMDYFLFPAVAGRTYRLVTSHLSAEMDTLLYLFGSDGQTILKVDDDSAGDGASRIEWSCPVSGTYFAMVRHAQATSGVGCYAISLSLEQVDDHGDNELAATPLNTSGRSAAGFLENPEDVDVFLFEAAQGYTYVVTLARTSAAGSLHVALANAKGELSASIEGEPAALRWTAESDGVVFVFVASNGDAEAIGYEIRVHREGYSDDHGNTPALATPMEPNGHVVPGILEVPTDEDWLAFDARPGSDYTIAIEAGDAGLDASLVAADGTTVLWQTSVRAGESVSQAWSAPTEGTYYLRTRSPDGIGTYAVALSATLKLRVLGTYNPQGYSLDVAASGTLAYLVVGTKGLVIVDASDPARPVEKGSHSTRGYAQAVAVSGDFAYVANRGEGITVIDVSDPTRPVQVGAADTSGSAQDIAVADKTAYVADQRGGLQVLDIRDPTAPSVVSTYETSGYAQAVAVRNGIAYVARGDAGLEIVGVSDPESPQGLGTLDLRGDASDVVVSGDLVYVAAGFRGIRIVDVSDPTAPAEVGSVSTDGEVLGLALTDGYLYATERTEGLSVYSLSDPLAPERIAHIDTPGEALRVAIAAGVAYVADREEGLQVIQLLP